MLRWLHTLCQTIVLLFRETTLFFGDNSPLALFTSWPVSLALALCGIYVHEISSSPQPQAPVAALQAPTPVPFMDTHMHLDMSLSRHHLSSLDKLEQQFRTGNLELVAVVANYIFIISGAFYPLIFRMMPEDTYSLLSYFIPIKLPIENNHGKFRKPLSLRHDKP